MELDALKDAFDRVADKRKQTLSKTQDVIEQVIKEIDQAIAKIQASSSGDDAAGSSDYSPVLVELKGRLNEMAPINQLDLVQREIFVAISKYVKLLEKTFHSDISKAYRNVDFDPHAINEIIAGHFYHQGQFDVGDCFTQGAHESDASSLKAPFQEMYGILEAMQSKNLEPALSWAAKNSELLLQNGSSLEMRLHQLQFFEILEKVGRDEALKYARTHLSPFASIHKVEIQKVMATLLWAGRLDQSPYSEFMSSAHWEKLAEELAHQFCSLLGQSYESPLSVVVDAGVQALPTLLKLSTVMSAKQEEWQAMKQLPVPIDLGKELQFHTVFVCPVLREQAGDENPPMLMPCGHVLSKQAIIKLSKSSTRPFKCPYCPSETVVSECRQIHF